MTAMLTESDPAESQPKWRGGRLAIASLWICLLPAGCSSGNPITGPAPSTPATASARPPGSAETSASRASLASTPASGAPGRATGAGQRQACQVQADNLSILTKAASSSADPTIEDEISRMRQLAQRGPDAIRDDLTVIADFDQHIVDEVRAGRSPEIVETPELTAAMTHEATWIAANCVR